MLGITTTSVSEHTSAKMYTKGAELTISEVTTDTRKLSPKSLFVAFKGERTDANDLLELVLAQDVSAFVMTREPSVAEIALAEKSNKALFFAADPEQFLLELAAYWRDLHPNWTVVGVTGSVGKTTTKDMLKAAFEAEGLAVTATKGNFNNLIGMPLTLLSANADDDVVVLEMGMNHKGELSRLTAAAKPNFALITNIGTSHIGLLGSRENIALAKSEIIEGMRPNEAGAWTLCLGADNDFADMIEQTFAKPKGLPVAYVGSDSASKHALSVVAKDIHLNDEGFASFKVQTKDGKSYPVTLNIAGTAVVSDALLAVGIVQAMGLDIASALLGIQNMEHTAMRLEIIKKAGCPRVIDDTYNASPTSIAAALEVLANIKTSGRKIAVIGEVGELGDEAEYLHGLMGAYLAAQKLDMYVFVGGIMAKHMANAAKTMGASEDKIEIFETTEAALKTIGPILQETDVVLAKGSRSVGLDRFVKGVVTTC